MQSAGFFFLAALIFVYGFSIGGRTKTLSDHGILSLFCHSIYLRLQHETPRPWRFCAPAGRRLTAGNRLADEGRCGSCQGASSCDRKDPSEQGFSTVAKNTKMPP